MSGKSSRTDRQAALDAIRTEQKSKERRQRTIFWSLVALPVVALIVIASLVIWNATKSSGLSEVPPSASGMGQPLVLNADAPDDVPVFDIYEDFQCPYCAQLENTLGDTFKELADENAAKVQLHLMSFLDASLGNSSSRDAIRGLAAADEQGKLSEYHTLVYANHPEEEGTGWTDEQLEQFAEEAGVEDMDAWRASFNSDKWDDYINSMQTESTKAGVTGTPTVKLDGEVVTDQLSTPETVRALVTLSTDDLSSTPTESATADTTESE